MPLDRFVLILVIAMAAAGITVWVGTLVAATVAVPGFGLLLTIPAALLAFIVWRVVAQRLNNSEDDHYDRIDR